MKTWMALIGTGAIALSLAGCNTIAGAGKDIERGGEKIQDASLKVRSDWRNARDSDERGYDAARAACNSGSEGQRDACRDRARADYTAKLDAERARYHRKEMRSESEEDRREDAYEAARNTCDALRGDAEDRCVADARARYRR
jgi:predicted small secreted protein